MREFWGIAPWLNPALLSETLGVSSTRPLGVTGTLMLLPPGLDELPITELPPLHCAPKNHERQQQTSHNE